MTPTQPTLDFHATTFSQGRMDFSWEALSEAERRQAYADWQAGKGLIGGDPHFRPDSRLLPDWGLNRPFFRTLLLDDPRGENGATLRSLLASTRPLEIEIGYGRGDFLLDRANRFPTTLFIGYETNTGATRRMLRRVVKHRQGDKETRRQGESPPAPRPSPLAPLNVWLSDDDARFSIPRMMADGRVDAFHILFPDPWWKDQHRIKRLFSPPFVDLLAAKLRTGGLLHFKSDVQEYGELVRYLVEQHADFSPHDPSLSARLGEMVMTHREVWCVLNQKPVFAYYFVKR